MLDHFKHIFLVPMKVADSETLSKIKEIYSKYSKEYGFLISMQTADEAIFYKNYFLNKKNVFVIHSEKKLSRTAHWEYVAKKSKEIALFETFSYYFSGDEINLENFPLLEKKSSIYINDYFISSWENIKENAGHEEDLYSVNIIRKNLSLGKPLLAPLQKIVFTEEMANEINFNADYTYVCDQLMIFDFIKKGKKIEIIKSPFYKLNENKRNHQNTMTITEILKQQLYLYKHVNCYTGVPMIAIRTLLKYYIFKK